MTTSSRAPRADHVRDQRQPHAGGDEAEDRRVVVVLEGDPRLEAGGVAGAQEQPRVGAGGGRWRASRARRRSRPGVRPPRVGQRGDPAGIATYIGSSNRRHQLDAGASVGAIRPPGRSVIASWDRIRSNSPGPQARAATPRGRPSTTLELDRGVALAKARHRDRHHRGRRRGERGQAERPALEPGQRPQLRLGVLEPGQDRLARVDQQPPASVSTAPSGTRRTSTAPDLGLERGDLARDGRLGVARARRRGRERALPGDLAQNPRRRLSSMTKSYTPPSKPLFAFMARAGSSWLLHDEHPTPPRS